MQRGRGRVIGGILVLGLALVLFGIGQGIGRSFRGQPPTVPPPALTPPPIPPPPTGTVPKLTAPDGVRLYDTMAWVLPGQPLVSPPAVPTPGGTATAPVPTPAWLMGFGPPALSTSPLGWNGSQAMAETSLTAAELEAHFAAQLADAGWTRLDGGAAATLAWSTWALPRPAGARGLLLVSKGPEPERRWLYVRVDGSDVP